MSYIHVRFPHRHAINNGSDDQTQCKHIHPQLGGNVILKSLGELGKDAIRLGVKGAALACVPFDAVRSSGKIDGGFFNRQVYAGNFLATLKA